MMVEPMQLPNDLHAVANLLESAWLQRGLKAKALHSALELAGSQPLSFRHWDIQIASELFVELHVMQGLGQQWQLSLSLGAPIPDLAEPELLLGFLREANRALSPVRVLFYPQELGLLVQGQTAQASSVPSLYWQLHVMLERSLKSTLDVAVSLARKELSLDEATLRWSKNLNDMTS
jgi:hypothetical protein